MKKIASFVLIALVILSLVLIPEIRGEVNPVELTFDKDTYVTYVNGAFTVVIALNPNNNQVGALQFNVTWDPNILEFVNYTISNAGASAMSVINDEHTSEGYIIVGSISLSPIPSGDLLILTFKGKTQGDTTLAINIERVGDMSANPIEGIGDTATVVVSYLPVADFSFTPEKPVVSQEVTFNASTSYDPDGFIVEYIWDFGDWTNLTTTEPVVTHTYTKEGTYNVTLTVIDDKGLMSTTSHLVTITRPTIVYIADSTIITLGTTKNIRLVGDCFPDGLSGYRIRVDFNPNIINITNVVFPSWATLYQIPEQGPGYIIIKAVDLMSQVEAGATNVTLVTLEFQALDYGISALNITIEQMDDDNGNPIEALVHNAIIQVNMPPVADFSFAPEKPYSLENVTFNASASYDPDGEVVQYSWDFGDGTNLTTIGPIVVHVYDKPGEYNVRLTVVDNFGGTNTTIKQIRIRNRKPIANFTFAPKEPYSLENVTFVASASDFDGYITQYVWDFGDGTNLTTTESVVTHKYLKPGNYTVTLTVVDDNSAYSDPVSKVITVKNTPPVADFSFAPEKPYSLENVTFNASASYDPDGSIVKYIWDFGDRTTLNTTTPIVIHKYTKPSNYTVLLTVVDDFGATNTTVKQITIKNRNPIADFTFTPEEPAVGQDIIFNASESYDPDGFIVEYIWDFGDGTILNTTEPIVTHAYTTPGNYTVELTVKDTLGGSTSIEQQITVINHPPVIENVTYSVSEANLTVQITVKAKDPDSDFGVDNISQYVWDFGDGSVKITTKSIVSHVYTAAGTYNITIKVYDKFGMSVTTSIIVPIYPPIANFTFAPEEPWVEEEVTFNASLSYDPDDSIVAYLWDFGDGMILNTTDPVVTHKYFTGGLKRVILTVTNEKGVKVSTTELIKVYSFRILIGNGTFRVNKTAEIPLVLDTSETLGALQLRIYFDPEYIQISNFTSEYTFSYNIKQDNIEVGIITLKGLNSGEFGTITFKGIKNGTTTLYGEVIEASTLTAEKRFGEISSAVLELYFRKPGDANDDDKVTAVDALIYLRFAVGLDISPYQLDPVEDDVTGDGKITAVDALKVLRVAVGLDKLN